MTDHRQGRLPLTPEQLARIEQHANAATEGVELTLKHTGEIVECGVGGQFSPTALDVELYVHAKSFVTELLMEVRALNAELEAAQPVLEAAEDWYDGIEDDATHNGVRDDDIVFGRAVNLHEAVQTFKSKKCP